MILDTCGSECLTVDLGIGSTITDTTRTLDIRVGAFLHHITKLFQYIM